MTRVGAPSASRKRSALNPLLTPLEARVLGCLIEKQLASPEYYPLTFNALVAACNQKSNRDPVMRVDEGELAGALDNGCVGLAAVDAGTKGTAGLLISTNSWPVLVAFGAGFGP